ncbi:MAG TPA: type II toxin-antitoxin system VapB family antitoxin [Candidatus Brocadiales bacterium]|nr:type II toxin-antitoxin system VapB family antitoxin [Candidatus Brocadiales bacterium]
MRTTLEIDEELVKEAMKASKAKTKKGAIVIALKEYLGAKRREELKGMIGNYDEFDLSLEKLEKMRREG